MMSKTDTANSQPEQRLQAVSDLVDIAGRLSASTVIIPGGSRLEDLQLTDAARDNGIIDRIILVGKQDRVHRAVEESGMDIAPQDIVAVEDDEAVARATVAHMRQGSADIVLKGDISTPILNRAMLPLAERPTVSLVSIFDAAPIAKGRPVILTDAGVTTVCNLGRMIDLVHNAVDVARVVMGIARPRVAALSANEKQIPSLPSTWMGLELARLSWSDAVVCGPLSFDLATSEKSVAVKGMPELPGAQEVAGRADILVCPGIDGANILYKALTAMTRYGQASIAGITVGFPIPYIILSRADALETRLDSIALCSIYAQKRARLKEKVSSAAVIPAAPGRRILAVNTQTTSIELALYEYDECTQNLSVPVPPPAPGTNALTGITKTVCQELQARGIEVLDAVCARGPASDLEGNVALSDPIAVLVKGPGHGLKLAGNGGHELSKATEKQTDNLGRQLTAALARRFKCTGLLVHAGEAPRLRIRAGARRAARTLGRSLDQVNLVLACLGPEGHVAALRRGKIVSYARVWPGPAQEVSDEIRDLCAQVKEKGWIGIERGMAEGNAELQRQMAAIILDVAQKIGGAFVAADCIVEAIVLTGEWVRSAVLCSSLRKKVVRLAPVQVCQGATDMQGLAQDARDVLDGRTQVQDAAG